MQRSAQNPRNDLGQVVMESKTNGDIGTPGHCAESNAPESNSDEIESGSRHFRNGKSDKGAQAFEGDLRQGVRRSLAIIALLLHVTLMVSVLSTPESVSLPNGRLQINVNQASPQELSILPQVGPVLARRIVLERDRLGDFADVEDLVRVHGIGPSTLEKIRPYCVVCNESEVPAVVADERTLAGH